MTALLRGGQLGGDLWDAGGKGRKVHGLTNDAGRGGQNVLCRNAEFFGREFADILGKLNAVRRAGVGVAAVHNDGLRVAVRKVCTVHRNRCAVDLVGGVAGCTRTAHIGGDERQIILGMIAPDAAVDTGGAEPLGGADAAGNEGILFHLVSSFSHQPHLGPVHFGS